MLLLFNDHQHPHFPKKMSDMYAGSFWSSSADVLELTKPNIIWDNHLLPTSLDPQQDFWLEAKVNQFYSFTAAQAFVRKQSRCLLSRINDQHPQ